MKIKFFNAILLSLGILLSVPLYGFIKLAPSPKVSISIMYTNKDYITSYGIYDLNTNTLKKLYSRKNIDYSDFAFDQKNNILYYSDSTNGKYDIFKVNLSYNNPTPVKLLDSNYNGDIFNLVNNKIIFRTFGTQHQYFNLGVYNLKDSTVNLWYREDPDATIYNFFCDEKTNRIYTIERSLSELQVKHYPNIPTDKIVQYTMDGTKEKTLYSTNKSINSISVDTDGKKLLFDAASFDGNEMTNKIYFVDLKTGTESVMIQLNDKIEGDTISSMKYPQFSSDKSGFYFLASTPKSTIIEEVEGTTPVTSRAIYFYQFSNKKINKVFEITDAVINSYKLTFERINENESENST